MKLGKIQGKACGDKPVQPSSSPLILFPHVPVDVVAIVASRGGLHALSQVLSTLPDDFPVAIVIVQHVDPHSISLLPDLLNRVSALKVKPAIAGERLQAGTVYVAPPNWHVLVSAQGTIELSQTQPVHFTRPSADVLLHSVAENLGSRSIAVILTGTGRDGADGIRQVKQKGGMTIAQDQETAEFFAMPQAAIATHAVDWVLPLDQIAATLIKLVQPVS